MDHFFVGYQETINSRKLHRRIDETLEFGDTEPLKSRCQIHTAKPSMD